ncbi:MAG: cobalamin-dependent protein [Bdellovibrionales bacterium]|nr:cobalamin-dependent protein [Bdellovibrionales bacterium]
MNEIDYKNLVPYGDTTGDGAVQFSFTFPVEPSPKAQEAAAQMVREWGFSDVKVAHMSSVGVGFAYFVIFGRAQRGVNFDKVEVPELTGQRLNYKEIDKRILEEIGRPIRVVGANTGFDAHTVGLDAILNMKGFDGDVGLERYRGFYTVNMGSQVLPAELIERALKEKADAILISKIVTQKDIHIADMKDVILHLRKRGLEKRFILVVGGPRVTHKLALELGYDAGFSIGSYPSDVAYFLLEKMLERIGKKK